MARRGAGQSQIIMQRTAIVCKDDVALLQPSCCCTVVLCADTYHAQPAKTLQATVHASLLNAPEQLAAEGHHGCVGDCRGNAEADCVWLARHTASTTPNVSTSNAVSSLCVGSVRSTKTASAQVTTGIEELQVRGEDRDGRWPTHKMKTSLCCRTQTRFTLPLLAAAPHRMIWLREREMSSRDMLFRTMLSDMKLPMQITPRHDLHNVRRCTAHGWRIANGASARKQNAMWPAANERVRFFSSGQQKPLCVLLSCLVPT